MRPFSLPTSKYGAKVADEGDIAQVIEWFATAAERLIGCGFDGIELHAGHGYILDSFLSPATNRRDDRWGGSLDNRARARWPRAGPTHHRVAAISDMTSSRRETWRRTSSGMRREVPAPVLVAGVVPRSNGPIRRGFDMSGAKSAPSLHPNATW